MGTEASRPNYSIVSSEKKPGETGIYRHPLTKNGLINFPDPDVQTVQDLYLRSFKLYEKRPYLASRKNDLSRKYVTKTYGEVYNEALEFGSGLVELGLVPETCDYKSMKMKLLGIFSKNREEWAITDVACCLYGMTSVPFYDTLGAESIDFIIKQTKLEAMVCSLEALTQLDKNYNGHGSLRTIICLQAVKDEYFLQKLKDKGITVYTFQSVKERGSKNIRPTDPVKPEDIYTFSYTSGTTGNPKGALLTHSNIASLIAVLKNSDLNFTEADVHLSYLPLPHIFERGASVSFTYSGASIYYYGGDVLKLKEDMAEVKPTVFLSVPRLYNKFYDVMKTNLEKVTGIKKLIVDAAVSAKLENLQKNCEYTHSVYDSMVFNKIKEVFGGRVRIMVTASAPISKEVLDFLKIATCSPILEAYGQTESTGGSFVTRKDDSESGHVGGPTVNTEFKLVDVPDMNYTSEDKDAAGNAQPRGEICLRGPGIFAGYYKDPEKTAEAIDQDGWLHTGDIGVILRNGALKIIDRKKNIFKLSQGEYIAPEKIENVYLRAKGVAEVFVHGDSLQSCLVGVVVPDKVWLSDYAKSHSLPDVYEELIANQAVKEQLLKNLVEEGKAQKLLGFEQVKAIHLEPRPFMELGIVTPSFKIKRFNARDHYLAIIQDLYKSVQQI